MTARLMVLYPDHPHNGTPYTDAIRRVLATNTPESLERRGWNVQEMRAVVAAAEARACLRSSVHAGAGKR